MSLPQREGLYDGRYCAKRERLALVVMSRLRLSRVGVNHVYANSRHITRQQHCYEYGIITAKGGLMFGLPRCEWTLKAVSSIRAISVTRCRVRRDVGGVYHISGEYYCCLSFVIYHAIITPYHRFVVGIML